MGWILKDRRKFLGGSDAGAIAGLSKWKTPYHVYLEKRGELPVTLEFEGSEYTEWGTRLEAEIAKGYAARTGRKMRRPGRTIRHPLYPYIAANVDRFQYDPVNGNGVLECKNANWRQRKLWVENGVPESYYIQLQHYLLVTGLMWGSFAVLFGGCELICFDIPRDEAVIAKLLPLEVEFWARVLEGRPPDPTYDAMGLALVGALYPKALQTTEVVLDSDEIKAKTLRLLKLKAAIKEREKIADELEAWLKFEIKEAERVLIPGIARISWKDSESTRLNGKKFKQEQPDVWMKYAESTSCRRFLVNAMTEVQPEDEPELDVRTGIQTGIRRIALD